MKNLCLLILVLFFAVPTAFSQNNNAPGIKRSWTIEKPFEEKVFVENKGQFDDLDGKINSKVLYSARQTGMQVFFTKNGLIYRFSAVKKRPKKNKENENDKKEKEESLLKPVITYIEMNWEGTNPEAECIAEGKVNDYYTFINEKSPNLQYPKTIVANAYRKVIYKNLYANIDVEYVCHEDGGIKYTLILHPGADPSKIKMHYSADKVKLKHDHSIEVIRNKQKIIDKPPVSFYAGTKQPIASEFIVDKNRVTFKLAEYNTTKTVIIDPWTINPSFTSANAGYVIAKSQANDIYVCGGDQPFTLKKFNSGGSLQWSLSLPNNTIYYATHCLDNSSNCYIAFGPWDGAKIAKIDPSGNVIFNNTLANPTYPEGETYDIIYHPCTNKLIGGGFSYDGLDINFRTSLFEIDQNTGNYSNFFDPNPATEIRSLAFDEPGNIYCFTIPLSSNNASNNNIIKVNPTLSSTLFSVPSGSNFTEGQNTYVPNAFSGFNGLGVGSNSIYSFDGEQLIKRSKVTGSQIGAMVAVTGGTGYMNSGILVDNCDNVYVGTQTEIRKYDSTLTFISSVPAPGVVYDICSGTMPGEILACGEGFVSSLSFNYCSTAPFTTSTSQTSSTCSGNDGTATVTAIGTDTAYTYTWYPGGQTTATATGLAPGTYIVTVYSGENCFSGSLITDTVVISANSGITGYSHTFNTPCPGNNNGSATLSVTGGTPPYTYLWSNGQTTQTITGLTSGTYTIVATDFSGCQLADSVVIPPSTFSLTLNGTEPGSCSMGSITTIINGGTPAYSYLWTTGDTTQNISNISLAGIYGVTITDANGCSLSDSVTLNSSSTLTPWSVSSVSVSNDCGSGGTALLHIIQQDSTNFLSFNWYDSNFNFLFGDSLITGLSPGTYYCWVTDFDLCIDTTVTVVIGSSPSFTAATSQINPVCNGYDSGSAWISSTTATTSLTYVWNTTPVQTTDSIANLAAGTYIYTITDSLGCQISNTVIITQPSPFSITSGSVSDNCNQSEGSATVTVSGASTPYSYLWNTSPVQTTNTATDLAAGSYECIITDANNCKDTVTVAVANIPGTIVANAGNNVTISAGTNTTLNATGGATYSWTPPSGLSCSNCPNPIAAPAITTDYCVTVYDTLGCFDTACVRVTVEYNGFIVPNSFSPNDDGKNDIFLFPNIYTQCFHCKIYNRWGTLIYEWENANAGWNGTIMKNGKKASDDVYYFILDYCDITNAKKNVTGFIQLLR